MKLKKSGRGVYRYNKEKGFIEHISIPSVHLLTPIQTIVFNCIRDQQPSKVPLKTITEMTEDQLRAHSHGKAPRTIVTNAIQVLKKYNIVQDVHLETGDSGGYRYNRELGIIEHSHRESQPQQTATDPPHFKRHRLNVDTPEVQDSVPSDKSGHSTPLDIPTELLPPTQVENDVRAFPEWLPHQPAQGATVRHHSHSLPILAQEPLEESLRGIIPDELLRF